MDEFAKTMARDLAKRYPPSIEGDGKKASARKLSGALEDLYNRVAHFKRENRLGIYRKAKLGNVLRWELKELGYSDRFTEEITKGVIVRLAQK